MKRRKLKVNSQWAFGFYQRPEDRSLKGKIYTTECRVQRISRRDKKDILTVQRSRGKQ